MGFLDFLFGKSEKQPQEVLSQAELQAINTPGDYTVKLIRRGAAMLQVVKCIRDTVTQGDLKAAKDISDKVPCIVKADISQEGAEILKRELEKLGAEVTVEQKQQQNIL